MSKVQQRRVLAGYRPAPGGQRLGGGGWSGRFRLLRRWVLALLIVPAALVALSSGVMGLLVYRHAHPPRGASLETPSSVFTQYADAPFTASDGVPLAGWWIAGRDGAPVLILAHDLGESRAAMLGLAAPLSEAGYSVFLFDFRGHGASGGSSSFGTLEKRDLLGAIDWVAGKRKADTRRIGIIGVGMGAHAAILAASERIEVRSLALDSPYANVGASFAGARLDEGTFRTWLTRASLLIYNLMYRVDSTEESAALRIRGLADRDLLFLAPKERPQVIVATRALYDSIPESKQHDKNLIILPATRTTLLYGEDRARYDGSVLTFCRSYLPVVRAEPYRSVDPHRSLERLHVPDRKIASSG